MPTIIEAPKIFSRKHPTEFIIFLAGSIQNGLAIDWQKKLCDTLNQYYTGTGLIILNPRRTNWDPDLDGKNLRKQIVWEQDGLEEANLIIFYFDPETHSPISLLELGQYLGNYGINSREHIIVFCPPTFFRHMNVEVTCERYGIKLHSDYNTFLAEIISKISRWE